MWARLTRPRTGEGEREGEGCPSEQGCPPKAEAIASAPHPCVTDQPVHRLFALTEKSLSSAGRALVISAVDVVQRHRRRKLDEL